MSYGKDSYSGSSNEMKETDIIICFIQTSNKTIQKFPERPGVRNMNLKLIDKGKTANVIDPDPKK